MSMSVYEQAVAVAEGKAPTPSLIAFAEAVVEVLDYRHGRIAGLEGQVNELEAELEYAQARCDDLQFRIDMADIE